MGNCCSKSKRETYEADVLNTDGNPPAVQKPEENFVLVNGAPTSLDVGQIADNRDTFIESANEPHRGDEQIITGETEQSYEPTGAAGNPAMLINSTGPQEILQNTMQPVSKGGYSYEIDAKDYVIDENREQDTGPAVTGGYFVTNGYEEQEILPVVQEGDAMVNNEYVTRATAEKVSQTAPDGAREIMATTYIPQEAAEQEHGKRPVVTEGYFVTGYHGEPATLPMVSNGFAVATNEAFPVAADGGDRTIENAYMSEEITEEAYLAGEAERNKTFPAQDIKNDHTQQTLLTEMAGNYTTVVPNGYVEAGPLQAPGNNDGIVAFSEMPNHTEFQGEGIVSQGQIKQQVGSDVGIVFEGRSYQNRVFDENLGHYVYTVD